MTKEYAEMALGEIAKEALLYARQLNRARDLYRLRLEAKRMTAVIDCVESLIKAMEELRGRGAA